MTPQEFKSWFDGFTEALTGVPTKAQWARIKERVAEIDGKQVTERVFVDRYYPSYPPHYWRPYAPWGVSTCNAVGVGATLSGNAISAGNTSLHLDSPNARYQAAISFNSGDAMAALGRADAKALAA